MAALLCQERCSLLLPLHECKFLTSKNEIQSFSPKGLHTERKQLLPPRNIKQVTVTERQPKFSLSCLSTLRVTIEPVAEEEKATTRRMPIKILEDVKFLARQGLPLRGSDGNTGSNFYPVVASLRSQLPLSEALNEVKDKQAHIP